MGHQQTDVKPSPIASWNSGGTAAVLPAERAMASFDLETMTSLLMEV